MTAACTTHPLSPWITSQGQHKCRGCESARKSEWRRKRRAAGLLPEQSAEARAARRDSYAWQQTYAAYHALCDRLGIPTDRSTP